MNLICETQPQWSDPRLVYGITIVAILLLAATVWLFWRSKREGRAAGMICLGLSIALHGALFWMLPSEAEPVGGSSNVDDAPERMGADAFSFSTFDASLEMADRAGDADSPSLEPLPVADLEELLVASSIPNLAAEAEDSRQDSAAEMIEQMTAPSPLAADSSMDQLSQQLDASLEQLLQSQIQSPDADSLAASSERSPSNSADVMHAASHRRSTNGSDDASKHSPKIDSSQPSQRQKSGTTASAAMVAGTEKADFANRTGSAKQLALARTGGDANTEAAVQAALRFLAHAQRPDGAWDPIASGAGVERMPLGEARQGAGTRATTGLTGLSLLALMGAGNTHTDGEYADNVYRGLVHLIRRQQPDGSINGPATRYAASYCHSMAALSLCEAAVMTGDPSAIEASRRAIQHTLEMQHPVTGGWRYTKGEPGDLSQLGWQTMVLDGGKRAGIDIGQSSVVGVARFLRSVRAGRGGLASYRPNEPPSRTMTAEALATRLLVGETVPPAEIAEAERYLLEALPGSRQDNYYYWYYATIALHQLQDDAWHRWNNALKERLLATQRPDGSWPSSTVWGGYGGTVYTTAMATLCLESYYRHALRESAANNSTAR